MENTSLKTGWKGFLSFTFENKAGKTIVKDKRHLGPLVVQRPYYQELGLPIVLIIHPPGGVVGGDELVVNVKCNAKSQSMVSTPAATKFYRSTGSLATQQQTIDVFENAELEWLPQETLYFNQSYVHNSLMINLKTSHAKVIAWDIVGLGRPESGEAYQEGFLKQTIEFKVAGILKFRDQMLLNKDNQFLTHFAGLGNYRLFATMLIYTDSFTLIALKDVLQGNDWQSQKVGITYVNGVLVIRVLGHSLDLIKQVLFSAWVIARPLVLNKEVAKPRIWNT